ncbi:bifunctional 2-polyprenyl-6-hydroxyphenol methylase/3-demethylubiquinol 3-O-methyltransferase UbiG [Roseicella sp. DB1501]|uniref:class I SAM-dependent methyltransferase n=1 Tax=Roseicella sp. DB1501 TaxID=2730925 RepID=UPI00149253A8|nr:class I SAM-dependent methyltransferase [Roseicella sp. DB1501]NOG68989.1 class I SAM-dependent methyltransferase [Roseicella sp. DB1501]
MPQIIYDDPDFFAAYAGLRRSVEGLDGAPEWPRLRALLPPLAGRAVLDLGCGYGWFARWARAAGAASVLGIDLSAAMLARARAMTGDAGIAYQQEDLETAALPEGAFDLAWSALALHYVADLPGLLGRMRAALRPGGRFVASMEHPVYTAPAHPGWTKDASGQRIWPLEGYAREGRRQVRWLGAEVVKQHRMLGTILAALRGAGLVLDHLEEFAPDAAQIAAEPALEPELDRPMFLLLAAYRPDDAD